MKSLTHKLGILATFVILFLFSSSVMGQNSPASPKANNKVTPIFNITKTTSGQQVNLLLSVSNVNTASAQQIKQGDSFVFAIDPASAADFEIRSDVQVRSSSLSPSDFSAYFDVATGEIKITFIGNEKIFFSGDSFGVELSFNDPTKAVAESVKAKGVIAAGANHRYNDFRTSSLDIMIDESESQAAKADTGKFLKLKKGPGLPALGTGSDISTFTFPTTINDHTVKRGRFTCPSSKLAINGGFTILGHDDENFNLGAFGIRPKLTSSGPGDDPSLWVVIVQNSTDNAVLGNFYFMCATR